MFLASCRYFGDVPEPHYGPEVVSTEQETGEAEQGSGVLATTQPIVLVVVFLVELSLVLSAFWLNILSKIVTSNY